MSRKQLSDTVFRRNRDAVPTFLFFPQSPDFRTAVDSVHEQNA